MDGGFIARLAERASTDPETIYATFNGTPISIGDLHRRSDAVAVALRRHGARRGDRIALMTANSPASVSLLFGIAKAGCVWVPINVQQRGDGLRYVIEHADPRMIFADPAHVATLHACGVDLAERRVIPSVAPEGTPSLETLAAGSETFAEALPAPEELFAINYTSGTTGRPKGVLVTHRMMRFASRGAALTAGARPGDVFFVWEPLYHIGGAQLIPIPLFDGVRLAMVDRFSASRFWDQVRASGATHIHYLGGILQILLKRPAGESDRDHKVRIAWGGGCPPDIWRAFEDRFGVEIRECYGMTEASSITTFNAERVVGSTGRAVPWLAFDIRDEAGAVLPSGRRGEIVVHPRQEGAVFAGYLRNPEATAKALRPDGFHTGDEGSVDDAGRLSFHGRLVDSFRVKGENVSAFEVEHVAGQHPGIGECALVAVAAEVGEQDLKLFVKPNAGAAIDLPEVSRWLGARLAPYQNPRYLALVEEFEKTPSQRIMKHRLSVARDDGWDRLADRAATRGP